MGEFGLIHHVTRSLLKDSTVITGVGDDCAVVDIAGETWYFSTDAAIESIHFSRDIATPYDIGWKSAAAALSDIAAMGGTPRFVLLSLAIPEDMKLSDIEQLYSGITDIVHLMHAVIIGGDTTRSVNGLFLDFCVIGTNGQGRCLLRSGSQPGDLIAVTGYPGDSAGGLLALQNNITAPELCQAHLHPMPRCVESQWLSQQRGVHAMIDLSDGLLQDCGHLSEASNLGFHIESSVLPVSTYLQSYADDLKVDPLDLVMTGGEAYELIFTVSPGSATKIQRQFEVQFNLPLSIIGKTTKSWTGVKVNGVVPEKTGYDHFLKT